MSKKYYEPWDKENYSFHRTDPKPWIPFADEPKRWSIDWKFVGMWLGCMFLLFGLPALVRWFPL